MATNPNTFVFIFDTGKLKSFFYGEVVFEHMMKGRELSANPTAITASLGDIFIKRPLIDIEPYVIKDDYCSLAFDDLLGGNRFEDIPYCWVVDNLSGEIARSIDRRLKGSVQGYVGLSRVDKNSTLERRQFWKYVVKKFSLYGNTITSFQDPEIEGAFSYSDIATRLGYEIEYDYQDDDCQDSEEPNSMQKTEKDIDRDLLLLNFSIRQELQISGALLWKSINSLSKIYFNADGEPNDHLVEYPFFTLYFASQGIERMQKAIVELICKKNHIPEQEKDSVYELLMSHAHDRLNNWIEEKTNIKPNTNCRKLLDILSRFYNTVRYARYSDETYLKATTPEYDLLLELRGSNSSELNNAIKNNFGNYLGRLAHLYFSVYTNLCSELGIYAYELEYNSAACIVYGHGEKPKNLYREFERRQKAKKEVLYWLVKKAAEYPKYSFADADALDFDLDSIEHYLWELVFNSEDGQDCFDAVESLYDELCAADKTKWLERLDLLDFFIDNSTQ